jgi:hypothetical protein
MSPASVRLQHIQQVHEASGCNLDALMPAAALAMAARAPEPLGGIPARLRSELELTAIFP